MAKVIFVLQRRASLTREQALALWSGEQHAAIALAVLPEGGPTEAERRAIIDTYRVLTDTTLADGLARLNGAITALRATLGGLGVEDASAKEASVEGASAES